MNIDKINKLVGANNSEQFIKDAKRYLLALSQRRVVCSIGSVSASGMSRTMRFVEVQSGVGLLNFYSLFEALGFKTLKNSDHFRVNGCGMDMVFATNYDIIHTLHNLGFISRVKCSALSQRTPGVI